MHCNTLQCNTTQTATHCNALHSTVTPCNTLNKHKTRTGATAEGWALKVSRWYYRFLRREDLSIRDQLSDARGPGRPRTNHLTSCHASNVNSCRPKSSHAPTATHCNTLQCDLNDEAARDRAPGAGGAPSPAKRAKKLCTRYNEQQLCKLQAAYVTGRDELDLHQVAADITRLHGGRYGVATISGLLKIVGLFCRISSLL